MSELKALSLFDTFIYQAEIPKYLEDKNGSLFAFDTWAYHSGNSDITSPRLTTWIRFTSVPCSTYYRDKHYLFKNNLDEINSQFSEKI